VNAFNLPPGCSVRDCEGQAMPRCPECGAEHNDDHNNGMCPDCQPQVA
jgi:rubrerythrin